MALQLRRGVDADRSGITPAEGELIYVTDTKKVWVGDGSTVGGVEFALSSNLQNVVEDVSPQLGGNLDLNSNNIIGVGNINITGTITASGNINLGDGSGSDQISVGGELTGGLVPSTDGAFDIGTSSLRWNTINANSANISGQIDAFTVNASLVADDSTLSFNKGNGTFTGALVGNVTGNVVGDLTGDSAGTHTGNVVGNAAGNHTGTFTGEVTGSLFGDDSSVLVDGVANKIVGSVETLSTVIKSGGSIARDLTRTFDTVTSDRIYDSSTDKLTAQNIDVQTINATGTITGTFTGNLTGTVDGDLQGSLYTDDSTLMVDAINQNAFFNEATVASVTMDNDPLGGLKIAYTNTADANPLNLTVAANDSRATLNLEALADQGSGPIGDIRFSEEGTYYSLIQARQTSLFTAVGNASSTGVSQFNTYSVHGGMKLKIEPANSDFTAPTEALEVLGNIKATGAFMLPAYADTTARDTALSSPVAGMMVYLTATNKAQAYNGTTWNDLF